MQKCVAAHLQYGNDLSIDWGHGAWIDDGKPKMAAGWIHGLEPRRDGLWATGVTWTALAAQAIRNREQRYFSPAFETDDNDHIIKVLNCALTIVPATHGLVPLVAHRTKKRKLAMSKYVSSDEVHAHADRLAELAEAMDSAKLKAMSEALHSLASAGKDIPDDADGDSAADKDKKDEAAAPAPDAQASTEAAPAQAAVDQAAAKVEALATLARARAAAAATPGNTASSASGTSDDAALAAVVRELTGKSTPGEARGALLAMRQGNGELKKLLARTAELESKVRKHEVEEFVRLAIKDRKLYPVEREGAIKLGMADMDALRTYVAEKAEVAAAPGAITPAVAPPNGVHTLTADEEKMIRIAGISRDSYIAARAPRS